MSTSLSSNMPGTTEQVITEPVIPELVPTGPDSPGPDRDGPVQKESSSAAGNVAGMQSVEGPFPWEELHTLPTRQLRLLCNRTFKAMDTDFPPADTMAQYAALIEEIDNRETLARHQEPQRGEGSGGESRGYKAPGAAFRDNPMARRFELFVDGDLAGYVKYRMHGGQVTLLETVIAADFSSPESGIEETLIHRTFLNLHQRRLAIKTRCGRVHAFLAEYPQYRYLVPATAQHTARNPSAAHSELASSHEPSSFEV
jgi:hypothetical protein